MDVPESGYLLRLRMGLGNILSMSTASQPQSARRRLRSLMYPMIIVSVNGKVDKKKLLDMITK